MDADSLSYRFYDDDDARPGLLLRERMEQLGQVSAELLRDLADAMAALQSRARLAAAEARAGRSATPELELVVQQSGDLSDMLRDALDVLCGRTLSPEVTFDVYSVVERAVRRFMPASRGVELVVVSTLDEPVHVHGRASFLFRSLCGLLANAVRHCRGSVQVELAVEDPRRMDEEAERVLCIDVEDDGAGLDPVRAATLFEPMLHTGDGEGGLGLSAVAWMAEQLGGWVRHRPGETLGGACFEIRLPLAEAG